MNVRWLKQNLVAVIFLAAVALVIGGTVYLERQAAERKQQIEGELEDQRSRLEQLRKGDPPPSQENLQTLKRDREELQQLYQTLQTAVGQNAVEPPKLQREIEFAQLMRETVKRLEQAATNNHVKTPDGFAFGFSRYVSTFPCRNPVAKPEECQKLLASLAKQLLVVEKLATLAIGSGIDDITSIRRTEVEPGAPSSDALPVPLGTDPKGLFHTYPFELQFACNAKALQSFLNGLTKSDWFFAVKTLKIDTETIAGSAAPTPAATAGAAAEKPEAKRLAVTARIDLIEFPGPETKSETKPGRKPEPES